MDNNHVLRSVRYALDLSDQRVADLVLLAHGQPANGPIDRPMVQAMLRKDDEAGFMAVSDEVLAHFLDGLVLARRGRDPQRPLPPIELPLYNNTILKRLRVAFELRDEDILAMLQGVGHPISKPELTALFRKSDHNNYRRCGDQLLRQFLKALTLRLRPGEAGGSRA
jgi:uncharacterized protein YehS (DUF1456 family)